MTLHIDGETRSVAELDYIGLHAYFEHPTTDVWCVASAFDDEEPEIWIPGRPCPPRVAEHIRGGHEVWAHSAEFEYTLINAVLAPKYGWPTVQPSQMHCTKAMASAMALPAQLDRAAAAVGLETRKDREGYRIMRMLCAPHPDGGWYTPQRYPDYHAKLRAYCIQDVNVEKALHKRLRKLSPFEQELWLMDQDINRRGITVDLRAVNAARKLTKIAEEDLNRDIQAASGGVIETTGQVAKIKAFIQANGVPTLVDCAKDTLEELEDDERIPERTRLVISARLAAAKASTKKLVPLAETLCKDFRLRGQFNFCGAGRTLRWSSYGTQLQNYPRQHLPRELIDWTLDNPELGFSMPTAGLVVRPMDLISQCLRGFLVAAPGHELLATDLSQIEARVLAWLVQDHGLLEEFKGRGKIYERAASQIFGIPADQIPKDDPLQMRQTGKVSDLAFGFGGGDNALARMERQYGLKPIKPARRAEIKNLWRASHPHHVRYWTLIEDAALRAMNAPPKTAVVVSPDLPRVAFMRDGSWLLCQGPSGSVVVYPYPKIEEVETPWGDTRPALTYQTVHESGSGEDKSWVRVSTWGGKLTENITQRTARDVFAEAMLRLHHAGYPIVLHAHDEAVIEGRKGLYSLDAINKIFAEVPKWATGLPIACEGWVDRRYRK